MRSRRTLQVLIALMVLMTSTITFIGDGTEAVAAATPLPASAPVQNVPPTDREHCDNLNQEALDERALRGNTGQLALLLTLWTAAGTPAGNGACANPTADPGDARDIHKEDRNDDGFYDLYTLCEYRVVVVQLPHRVCQGTLAEIRTNDIEKLYTLPGETDPMTQEEIIAANVRWIYITQTGNDIGPDYVWASFQRDQPGASDGTYWVLDYAYLIRAR